MAMDFPLDGPMRIYPVSDLVNNPKADDPRCIEPVRIERDNGYGCWYRWWSCWDCPNAFGGKR
jgi:hypothetical protein